MTPAEQMREAAAKACEDADNVSPENVDALQMARDIRALPLPEDAPLTMQTYMRLRTVMLRLDEGEAHSQFADDLRDAMDPLWHALTPTERVLVDAEAPLTMLARDVAREWRDYRDDGSLLVPHEAFIDALTALLDAMAEGWDVVEEGEGDG